MNFLTRFFIFCAGASSEILEKCPPFEASKYTSIGLTVFFTALLAVISSFFAFSIVFEQTPLIVIFSLLWGAIIFNLDRYIVSTMRISENKFQEFLKAIPRMIIAFLIAVIISKPLEIKIFENEINSFLMLENSQKVSNIDSKYKKSLSDLSSEKTKINSQFNQMLLLREKYYEDFKCECDGTCGTQKKGRGIECFSKKAKYDQFLAELNIEKIKRNSSLVYLEKQENALNSKIDNEIKIVKASFSNGIIDQIRALNNIDKMSSMFIILIFIMIEIAPILTKLLSSKGPYDNLILEYERAFEINYLKAVDDFDHERLKNKKLKEMSTRFEIKSKESQIQNIIKKEAYDRYEKIREQLENEISDN